MSKVWIAVGLALVAGSIIHGAHAEKRLRESLKREESAWKDLNHVREELRMSKWQEQDMARRLYLREREVHEAEARVRQMRCKYEGGLICGCN